MVEAEKYGQLKYGAKLLGSAGAWGALRTDVESLKLDFREGLATAMWV